MDIGIIGGADGPTAIFLSSGRGTLEAVAAIIIIVAIAGVVIIRKIKNRNR
jgi:Na+-transporting methylmalonyl-CoA/oxaloacetate decarboxylase beta subunit